jgi:hypothetical protein
VLGFDDDGAYLTTPIYDMPRLIKQADGKYLGVVQPVGTVPSFMMEIEDNGIPFPRSKFAVPSAA